MTGYILTNLKEMINELGEDRVKSILSDFSCPMNEDVQYFLKFTAIEFAKQGLSQTFLVFASYKEKPVLVGYFTLANKFFHITKNSLSKTLQKRISKFAEYDQNTKRYILSAPLIAQLGKNYSNGYNKLILGEELLKMACDKITEVQLTVGGKVAYLECEDKPKLTEFYSRNGFVNFGKRELERDETDKLDGKYLIQMLRYFR